MKEKGWNKICYIFLWALSALLLSSSISIDSPSTPPPQPAGTISSVVWEVTSDAPFRIFFTGDALSDEGFPLSYPLFVKQDVNASGNAIPNKYDHLETVVGIVVSGHSSVETGTTWGGGSNPNQLPHNLVTDPSANNSPHQAIGDITPNQTYNTATITLYFKGGTMPVPAAIQAGKYTFSIDFHVESD